MRLKSFEIKKDLSVSMPPNSVFGRYNTIPLEYDTWEFYTFDMVTDSEFLAWTQISEELNKKGISNGFSANPMPGILQVSHGYMRLEIEIRHVPGTNLKDLFNDQFRLDD